MSGARHNRDTAADKEAQQKVYTIAIHLGLFNPSSLAPHHRRRGAPVQHSWVCDKSPDVWLFRLGNVLLLLLILVTVPVDQKRSGADSEYLLRYS